MSEFTMHLGAIWTKLTEEWYLIAGIGSALWYALIRVKRAAFHDYVTTSQMSACKDEIVKSIEQMRIENNVGMEALRKEQSEGSRQNAQQHQDILSQFFNAIADLRINK